MDLTAITITLIICVAITVLAVIGGDGKDKFK